MLKSIPARALAAFSLCLGLCLPGHAADWPMGRCDANRSAASSQALAADLHLHWVRELPPLAGAWPEQAKMQFDIAYDPVVLDKTLFLASSRHDWVAAFDAATGAERWRFFAEGPVRFAPVAWEGRVYFASDDGHLYCLDAAKGALLWKFRGGPSDRRILGNSRLISTWPARGAPVIADGTVYFAASIWPFMGIFVHALDARTGQVVWTNDGDGSVYMKQPHNTDSFAGVAPQGPLVIAGDRLLVPGGRSVPACFDRKTGKLLRYQLAENGKRGGGSEVCAINDQVFFNGGAAFDVKTEKYLAEVGKNVVLTPRVVYTYSAGACRAYDFQSAMIEEIETIDRKGETVKTTRWAMEELASCKTVPVETLIKAGNRLYLGAKGLVQAVDLDLARKEMTHGWQAEVEGTVVRLAAAADRLFAVTREGRVYCFGKEAIEPKIIRPAKVASETLDDGWAEKAAKILDKTKVRAGYCIAWGIGSRRLVQELVKQSDLHVLVVEANAKKVQALRELCVAEDLTRLAVIHDDPATFTFPPYLASLMVSESWSQAVGKIHPDFLARAYLALRPFGGAACFFSTEKTTALPALIQEAKLAKALFKKEDGLVMLIRAGALLGSADWTHEHADAANTRVSHDQLVKAPLGILWFGGPSHEGILPRHGHGPQPQVIDGRLIIEGVDLMRAIDIYTGRLLWETRLPGVGKFYNNLSHQPGANASGSNYVSLREGIYVAYGKVCVVLDPATGKKLSEFALPELPGVQGTPRWGYVNVTDDYLIGGADPLLDPELQPPEPKPGVGPDKDPGTDKGKKDDPFTKILKNIKSVSDNMSASMHLVVMDRKTGQPLWTASARSGFRHNATCVGGGRLYTIDRISGDQLGKLKRRGEEPPFSMRLLAFDLKTGKEVWSSAAEIFGTWLSYSAKHDVLIEAGRVARDSLFDEPKGMRAYQAKDGRVLWFEKTYAGPAMLHGDTILQGQGGCDLASGALKMRVDPITGLEAPWTWIRNYGCNTPAASEHLITFRSGAAGYFDYCNDGGTGNFGGFRSSCTNNLIVAGGLLTAPEYTRTCTCSYQNQSSVALIHMPEAEMWTFFGTKDIKGPIQRVGINLGGLGDRRADDGALWLEYPSVAGTSPAIHVTTKPEALEFFRRHSAVITGKGHWIACSGAKGLSEITIALGKSAAPRKFTVKLYFAEPEAVKTGERLFSVDIQGSQVAKDLDIVAQAGGRQKSLVKEFRGIIVQGDLTIRLTPSPNAPNQTTILCGIEVVAEVQP